ncbi:MAG: hypothetical protein ABJM58_11735 [Alteripontixanthobacter sp.]
MGRRRKRSNILPNGRSNISRFARLDHRILHSPAYRALSPNDRSLLVELISIYNGDNNGSLYLSVRDAANRMGIADLTAASRSFDVLQAASFIEMTEDACFHVKASARSRARCWRLMWLPGPGRKAPCWDFLNWQPEPKTAQRRRMERGLRCLKNFRQARDSSKLPVLDSLTMHRFSPDQPRGPVLDSNTVRGEYGGKPPKRCVRDSATHIATPWGEGVTGNPCGWWKPDWTPSIKAWTLAAHIAAHGLALAHERKAA